MASKRSKELMAMLKIALDAGHRMDTPGKRCLKSLDPNETREWWLNDRIADRVEKLLAGYNDVDVLRVDDTTGKKEIDLSARCKAANTWNADFYLSIHHNAGINGGSGGGIVAYMYPGASSTTKAWRDELYNALIAHTGLKGNRSSPKSTGNYFVLRETKAQAVLLELGFMDSRTDVPKILTDEYAQQCAEAIVEVIVKRGGLKKATPSPTATLYRVQVGAFSKRENAEKLSKELQSKGYQTYVVKA
jgi:N-acetylmuramoyl-L-alanine amidase